MVSHKGGNYDTDHDESFFGCTATDTKIFSDLVTYIENEEIKPLLVKSYPLQELPKAQQAFIDKKHIGKFSAIEIIKSR